MDIKTKIQIIKNEIVKCSMFEYQEIYKIIKSNKSNYSKNINGIFIDLQRLDTSVIDQIHTYIMYCNKLTKNINAYEDIKNNIIKTNFQSLDDGDDIKIETITDADVEEENSLPVIKNKVSGMSQSDQKTMVSGHFARFSYIHQQANLCGVASAG